MAGKAGAHYRENGKEKRVEYDALFTDTRRVLIPQLGELCWYPNRDSLGYEPLYGLKETPGFVRTTLRHPAFMRGWQQILQLKLTEESPIYSAKGKSMAALFQHHLDQYKLKPVLDNLLNAEVNGSLATERLAQLDCLGFFDEEWIMNRESCSPADLLQIAVENRLALQEKDRDMIVMLHELEYELDQRIYRWQASLVVKGEDSLHTAMSKTVGLPLGIASRLLLKGIIQERGIRIPVSPEIYRPVLRELQQYGIAFVHEQTEIIPIAE
jgi:saccharopine dehydrogenase-like NADP-dependent oxidoreductase